IDYVTVPHSVRLVFWRCVDYNLVPMPWLDGCDEPRAILELAFRNFTGPTVTFRIVLISFAKSTGSPPLRIAKYLGHSFVAGSEQSLRAKTKNTKTMTYLVKKNVVDDRQALD